MTKSIGRLAALALIAIAALFTGSSAAQADPEVTPSPRVSTLDNERSPSAKAESDDSEDDEDSDDDDEDEDHSAEDERHHEELHDQYGNDVDQVFLPPLVVKPGSTPVDAPETHNLIGAVDPGSQFNGRPLVPLKSANQVNPAANIPVDVELVSVTDQTPADQFFQAATFGLGSMSVGAVGLGAVAVTQRNRQRRDNNTL